MIQYQSKVDLIRAVFDWNISTYSNNDDDNQNCLAYYIPP